MSGILIPAFLIPIFLIFAIAFIRTRFYPKCRFCGAKTYQYDIFAPAVRESWSYIRGYNELCTQAVGDKGKYCMNCGHIEWSRSFEDFKKSEPDWVKCYPDDPRRRYFENEFE